MQWVHFHILHNLQEWLPLFSNKQLNSKQLNSKQLNRKINIGLFNYILLCNIFLMSACTENKNNSSHVTNRLLDTSLQIKKVNAAEYIQYIVLKKDVNITDALNSLKIYNIQLIKDLKRNRYLVELRNNPGIERLHKDIIGSEYIKFIQPNFSYKSQ